MSTPVYSSAHAGDLSRLPRDLIRYRRLLWSLVSKELRARYRYATIGFAWALLYPLMMMLILTVVFTQIIDIRGLGGESPYSNQPYPLVILCALIFWQFSSNAINRAAASLIDNRGLVSKVFFPREIVPLAAVAEAAINCVLAFGLLLAIQFAIGDPPGAALIYVPVIFAVHVAMLVGVGLALSMLNALYRDVQYLVEVIVLFGFYMTPVFYELSWPRAKLAGDDPWLFRLYCANPMVGLISAYRETILGNRPPDFVMLAWPAVFAVVSLIVGGIIFRRRTATVADFVG